MTVTPDPAAIPQAPPDDLAAVRELVLRAHPQVVPELVRGESIAELIASVEPAAAAWSRIAESVTPATPAVPQVPAGGNPPVVADPDHLPAAEKIRRGLAAHRR